jgi:hypothetical protein
MIANVPRHTASSGPADADTNEPTAKQTKTVDPEGKTDTKKKLDAKPDKSKDETGGKKK